MEWRTEWEEEVFTSESEKGWFPSKREYEWMTSWTTLSSSSSSFSLSLLHHSSKDSLLLSSEKLPSLVCQTFCTSLNSPTISNRQSLTVSKRRSGKEEGEKEEENVHEGGFIFLSFFLLPSFSSHWRDSEKERNEWTEDSSQLQRQWWWDSFPSFCIPCMSRDEAEMRETNLRRQEWRKMVSVRFVAQKTQTQTEAQTQT